MLFLISRHRLAVGSSQLQTVPASGEQQWLRGAVLANLANAQALVFDHLDDLQFKAGAKDSSGFRVVHVRCRFRLDNLSLCLFKLDHHTLKWEKITSARPPKDIDAIYSLQGLEADLD